MSTFFLLIKENLSFFIHFISAFLLGRVGGAPALGAGPHPTEIFRGGQNDATCCCT